MDEIRELADVDFAFLRMVDPLVVLNQIRLVLAEDKNPILIVPIDLID